MISLKQWLATEAQRMLTTPAVIYNALRRGDYKNVTLRHVNKRVVFVRTLRTHPHRFQVNTEQNN